MPQWLRKFQRFPIDWTDKILPFSKNIQELIFCRWAEAKSNGKRWQQSREIDLMHLNQSFRSLASFQLTFFWTSKNYNLTMTSKQLAKNRTRKKLEQKNLFSSACWWRSSAGTRRRRSRESTASAASPWLTTSRGTFRNLDIFWFQKRKKKKKEKEKIELVTFSER